MKIRRSRDCNQNSSVSKSLILTATDKSRLNQTDYFCFLYFGYRRLILRACIFLGIFLISNPAMDVYGQDKFTSKIEELADKLISSALYLPRHSESEGVIISNSIILVPGFDRVHLKSVYRRLENSGFNPGPYTENDLSQLSESIRAFQELAKKKYPEMEVNGKIDSLTWEKLQNLYDPLVTLKKMTLFEFVYDKTFNKKIGHDVFKNLSRVFLKKGFSVIDLAIVKESLESYKKNHSHTIGIDDIQKICKSLQCEVAVIGYISLKDDNLIVQARLIDVQLSEVISFSKVEMKLATWLESHNDRETERLNL